MENNIKIFGGAYLNPVYSLVDPTAADNGYRQGQPWLNVTSNKYWILLDVTAGVASWGLAATIGGGTIVMDTITDPAVNAAVLTAVIDNYGGTIITLTAAGNAQTLQSPTVTDPGSSFIVVNNDTSTDDIEVNGITVSPGEAQKFIWDGTAWMAVTAIDADDLNFTPSTAITSTDVQAAIVEVYNKRLSEMVANNSGGNITNKIVTYSGRDAASEYPEVDVVTAVTETPFGFVSGTINDTTTGSMLFSGVVQSSLNLSGSSVGDGIYFDATGTLTATQTGSQKIGYVLTTTGTNDYVYVNVAGSASAVVSRKVTASDTVLLSDSIIEADCSVGSADITLSLPAASSVPNNKEYEFPKIDDTTYSLFVDPDAADTINGSTAALETDIRSTIRIRVNSDKDGWNVI